MGSVPEPRSRLTDAEQAARDRHRERTWWSLRHPANVVNEHAMRDALADALAGKVALGGWRRGLRVVPEPEPTFDWNAVVRHADEENARSAYESMLHPKPVVAPRRRRMRGPIPASSDRRRARYIEAVVSGECDRVRETPPGDRQNTLASASFKVGLKACDTEEAFNRLLDAARECGLSDRESIPTIRSGLRAGCRREAA